MKKLLLAFRFFIIVPVGDAGEMPDEEAGSSSAYFPVIGLIEGMMLLLTAVLCLRVFPAELTNGILLLVMVVLNGGLHLDGLADTFDAIASRGDIDRKLEIMKDGTIGPLGVVSIVMALLLKYLLLNAVFFNSKLAGYYASVFLVPVLSRWVLVPVLYHGRSARKEGLGRVFIDFTGRRELLTATMTAAIIIILKTAVVSEFQLMAFTLMFVMPLLYMYCFAAVRFSNSYFRGMTGDTVGAFYEIAVLLTLVMFCIRGAL